MPISFLDQQQIGGQQQEHDSRLKARQLAREFAAYRFGIFKESGFVSDFMYPPYSSVAGLPSPTNRSSLPSESSSSFKTSNSSTKSAEAPIELDQLRGFDAELRECNFETSSSSGLPTGPESAACLPYLIRAPTAPISLNLMSADPFSYGPIQQPASSSAVSMNSTANVRPIQWGERLARLTSWHFCGENFQTFNENPNGSGNKATTQQQQQQQLEQDKPNRVAHFEHNQRASNKQNKMCQERSALEVIRNSNDFRQTQFR